MKLDAGRLAMAVANVLAAAGLICAVIYKVAPDAYARGANFLLHTDMYTSTRTFGWGELILAALVWWFLAAIITGAAATFYNHSVKE